MREKATLIITHSNPDLDAVGFVYSARKVFGFNVLVKCGLPTEDQLEDPTVIVGDVGLPGYEHLGYNPDLNNFDHHYSYAHRSATFLFNQKFQALREDIVEYIDAIDLWKPVREEPEANLKVAVAGIRVQFRGADKRILDEGGAFLRWLEEAGRRPGDLSGTLPEKFQTYLRAGIAALRQIQENNRAMQRCKTGKGRSLGYVQTTFPIFSMVKEDMFARGIDIAVVHNPEERRFSIASNLLGSKGANLKKEGLVEALNQAEREKGASPDQTWGGHEDRIGSPKPSGSLLSAEEILEIVKKAL